MNNIECIFFDIGYTLINEDDVWERRCIDIPDAEISNLDELMYV